MKKILCRFVSFALSAALCMSMGMTAAAKTVEPMEDNSIAFSVKPEYRDEVLADPEGAFAGLHPAGVYITGVSKKDGGGMTILLVLPERGEQARQEAIGVVSADSRVSYVRQYTGAPFENVNTLNLSAEKNTIHVGEMIAIRQDGELRIYSSPYNRSSLFATPKGFDPNKEYTVEDFPQIPLKEVKKSSHGEIHDEVVTEITEFKLVLDKENPNYFDLIHAADILARSSDIADVHLEAITGVIRQSEFCTVSDSSIAQFTNMKPDEYAGDALVGKANEDGAYILEGLAPGKVTVTYYLHKYPGSPYTVQTEITVMDNEPQSSGVSDTQQSDSSESNPSLPSNSRPENQQTSNPQPSHSQTDNPKTGDASPIAAVGLFVLAGGSGLWIALRRKRI